MLITKRMFMAGIGASAMTAVVAPALGGDWETDQREGIRIRRSFNDPKAKDDVEALAKGLKAMKKRKDFLSLENQRSIHANHFRQHGCWRFFPWHRAQLIHFEEIIAKLSGKKNFALPYWDAQENHVLPKVLLTKGSAFYVEGREAGAKTDYSIERWNFSTKDASILDDDFDTFVGKSDAAGKAESYGHNAVHVITGGKMGDVITAPLDPLFWIHHCNVDRVWASWQAENDIQYPVAWQQEEIGNFVGPNGPVPNTVAGALIDLHALRYRYDQGFERRDFAAATPPPPPPAPGASEGGSGIRRRLQVVGEDIYDLSATMSLTGRSLSLQLPEAAVAVLRGEDSDYAIIEGSGTVRYAMQNLARRVITITASAATQPNLTLGSAPAFFHAIDAHAGHAMPPDTYAQIFSFRDEIRRLVKQSTGPVTLSCDTIPLSGPDTATPPMPVALELKLKIVRKHWV